MTIKFDVCDVCGLVAFSCWVLPLMLTTGRVWFQHDTGTARPPVDTWPLTTHRQMHTHTQNKLSNPGLEKLSDDTAACITAKTFTLLFFHNPFIFLLSFLFILAFCFSLFFMGTSLAGDVLTPDGGSGIHTKGKHSQGHSRQGYLYDRDEKS